MEVLPGLGDTPANIMQAFMKGLKEFNDGFSANLGTFSGSLEMIQNNLAKQSQFLEQLERADFKTLISSSIELVEKFEKVSINFGALADYSDRAMIVFREISTGADKANDLLNRFGVLDHKLSDLSDEYKNNSLLVYEAVNFFKTKYETLNNGVDILKNHLASLDSEMDDFLRQESSKLKATTASLVQSIIQIYGELAEKEMISKLQENTVLMQKFEPVFKDISNKIKEDIAAKLNLSQQLLRMSHSIEALNSKIPPSPLAQPKKFYDFMRNNGNNK
jgi:predicted  nucleic acid-binding Zn-ribbon protein